MSDPTKSQSNGLQSSPHGWRWLPNVHPAWYWGVNLVAVMAVVFWLFNDARFEASVDWWQHQTSSSDRTPLRDMGDWRWLGLRNQTVVALGAVVVASGLPMILGLWWGPKRGRTVKAWLVVTSIIAAWAAVCVGWQDIAWYGKQQRLRAVLQEYDQLVLQLNDGWPKRDGELPVIGPFMAYPTYQPATLIMLTLPELDNTDVSFGVIEGGDQVVRFELVGAERGDWLEWHPQDSAPANFVSGLGERYQVTRFDRLTNHWFLVRYE